MPPWAVAELEGPSPFSLKQGETTPRIRATLRNGDRSPIDLTGATVKFRMGAEDLKSVAVDAVATIRSALEGKVEYAWQASDTDEPGEYVAEWLVIRPDGSEQTVPTRDEDRHRVEIEGRL